MKLWTVLIQSIATIKFSVHRRIKFFEESKFPKNRIFRRIFFFRGSFIFGESTKLSWGCSSSSIFFQSFKTGTFGASSSLRRLGSFVLPFEGWRFWFFFSFISSRDLFGGWRSSVSESRLKIASVFGKKIHFFYQEFRQILNFDEPIISVKRQFRWNKNFAEESKVYLK